jgi:hypothetical protein
MAKRHAQLDDRCFVCGRVGADLEPFVLLQGRATRLHCSSLCLADTVERLRRVASRRRRRRVLVLLTLALLAVGVNTARRHRLPHSEWISGESPEALKEPSQPGPPPYGPGWPPTDEEWTRLFTNAKWIHPLPGPQRHAGAPDPRLYGPATKEHHQALCRTEGRCGVDLGGDLWGEHVYAAHDGVVDRVVGGGRDDHGGQYVRIAHFGGLAFTQYFHLAAIPRGISRGAHVRAGELIGLLGDTGTDNGRNHLYFALSARPSPAYPEVYWDPSPWMGTWPLRVPPNGSVAGFVLTSKEGDMPRRHRSQ